MPTPDDDHCPKCRGMGTLPSPDTCGEYATAAFELPIQCHICDGTGHALRCTKCGELLQYVRPGEWQCNNEHGEEQEE